MRCICTEPNLFLKLINKKTNSDSGGRAFMNKGITGNWKKHFTPEIEARFEEWEEKWFKGTGMKFQYQL